MSSSEESTTKQWKLRVVFQGEEPELLPKVGVSSLKDLNELIAKEFPNKLNGKTFKLKAMDDDFGDFFTLNDRIFASLPAEGHRDIQVVREGEDSADPSRPSESTKKEKPKSFDVERKEIKDEKTGEVVDTQVIIVINSKNMRDYLRGEISNDELYEVTPRLKAHELLVHLKTLRDRVSDYDNPNDCPFKELVDFLELEYGDLTTKLDGMIAEGVITFPYLWYLFKKGVKIYGTEQNTEKYLGGEIASFSYRSFMMFSFFSMQVNCFVADGQHFYNYTHEFTISEFKGLKKLKDLPVRVLDDETKEKLTRRGHIFRDLGLGAHYKHYKGNLTRASWFGPSYFKADGRVMVDGGSFRRMNPNYANDVFRSGSRNNSSEVIDDSQLWMTWPSLLGFSFSAKKWGELTIEDLTDINFDDHAFDRLVLAPEKKQMVKALVENQRGTFADIITGKGGGCIFLLHGSPGVGKTLTAEAIAELLHRPLYSVSVGELGTSTDVLEERLREILEVASTWNAVVLLDEADIFLEKRTEQDIKRNAMVGIFLRLLEYHQGVMFLTTNRVRSFDPAFHSRISVALKYRDLDEEARRQIWANFLEVTGINAADISLNDLAKYDINGRQIKTTVRLAQALAKSENKPVSKEHILRTLGITEQFKKDMLRASQGDLY